MSRSYWLQLLASPAQLFTSIFLSRPESSLCSTVEFTSREPVIYLVKKKMRGVKFLELCVLNTLLKALWYIKTLLNQIMINLKQLSLKF